MADVFDKAQEVEERYRAISLLYRKPVPEPTGFCFNCEKELGGGMKFCDSGCRDDWQKSEDSKKRNGI